MPEINELLPEDIVAIKELHQAWTPAIVDKDFDTLIRLYTDDAIVLPPNGPKAQGRAAVLDWMKAFPAITDANLTIEEIDGYGDLAFVRGAYFMTIVPDGTGEPIQDRGKFIEIRRKQADGSWLMARDIFNSDLPAS